MTYTQTKRVTLSSSSFTKVEFEHSSDYYMVKNFSSDDIYVSFLSDATTENSNKIASKMGQIVSKGVVDLDYDGSVSRKPYNEFTDTIYVKGSGEVEISQI